MTRRTTVCAVLLTMSAAGSASATDLAVRTEANRFFREGNRLVRQEQYSDALVRYERTIAYRPRPNVLWNAAMCHLHLGHRDMALWFMDRYLFQEQAARDSLEVQQALTAIAEEPDYIAIDRRAGLAERLTTATEAAIDGDASPAQPPQQVFGAGSGGSTPEAAARWQAAERYGSMLFGSGLDQITEGDWEAARAFFERSLAYRSLRNAAYNIAVVHLASGRRDLAVYFYRMYVAGTRQAQGDPGVEAAIRAIEDSPPRVGNQARRNELSDQLDAELRRALGETPAPSGTPPPAGPPPAGP